MLQHWRDRLATVWTEQPLDFIHIKHFDADNEFQLTDKYVESVKEEAAIRTSGQNLGRPLPVDCISSAQHPNFNVINGKL